MTYRCLQVFFVVFFLGFRTLVCSQSIDINKKICLNISKSNPRDIIYELEKKSGFRFAFQSDLIKSEELISINNCEFSISEILQQVFSNEDLELILTGKQVIVIKPKPVAKHKITENRPLIKEEIDDIENSLTKQGEVALDTLNRKYAELITIDRITISSIINENPSDNSIKLIEKQLFKVDYDTNTFIIYDTTRTKFARIVMLGLSKIASIKWSGNEKSDSTIIHSNSQSNLKFKRSIFHFRFKHSNRYSILRKKNDHLERYEERNYKRSFLNSNYFLGLETGKNFTLHFEPKNYTIPENFSFSGTHIKTNYIGGLKVILNENDWETDIGIRYQKIQMDVSGYNYSVFTDSLNIIDRNIFYTYNKIPTDTFYKYFPGRDTVWVTIYDSVRVQNEILSYGKDSLKNNMNSTLSYHHFEIPIGVGYNFTIYKNFKLKPQLSLIYSYDRADVINNNTADDRKVVVHEKEFSSLLVSLDLNLCYSFNDWFAFYAKLYACNSAFSFSKDRNWDYYSAYGAGIGLTCRIRSKK